MDNDNYDVLLGETNLTILQQVIGADTATISEEELAYYNPDDSLDKITTSIEELVDADYLEPIEVDTPEDLPTEFFAATPTAREDLKEVNLWEEMGIIYQMYQRVERTERIKEIEKHKPDGLL